MTRRAMAALLLVSGLLACGPTLYAVRSYRGHAALDVGALATIAEIAEGDAPHKADVLSRLGPPVGVVGQAGGDVFVYRYVARDSQEVNLNPAFLVPSAPSVPLYLNRGVSGRDDVLLVFFDADGRLVDASMRRSVDAAEVGDEGLSP